MNDFVLGVEQRGPKVGTIYGTALAFVENSFLRPSVWNALSPRHKRLFKTLNWMGITDNGQEYVELPSCIESLERMYPQASTLLSASPSV
jgi:hypothetical protein